MFLFSEDRFQKPNPFSGDIVVGIDDVIEKKLAVVEAMPSQFYEGGCCDLPTGGLPTDAAGKEARRKEVRDRFSGRFASTADRYRPRLAEFYGPQRASRDQVRGSLRDLRVRPPAQQGGDPPALPVLRGRGLAVK